MRGPLVVLPGRLERTITFGGTPARVACDGLCHKAWGVQCRPRDADEMMLRDHQLGDAPADPGTYEGASAKPTEPDDRLNRWCVRQCERCAMSRPGRDAEPIQLPELG